MGPKQEIFESEMQPAKCQLVTPRLHFLLLSACLGRKASYQMYGKSDPNPSFTLGLWNSRLVTFLSPYISQILRAKLNDKGSVAQTELYKIALFF